MKEAIFTILLFIRKAVYVTLASFDRAFGRKNQIFILAYHSVAKDNFRFSIDPSVIKKQILSLKKTHDFITLGDLGKYIANPSTRFARSGKMRPAVVLTFDDGYKDILLLKDFFVKHGIRPALFVLSDTKHANWKEIDPFGELPSAGFSASRASSSNFLTKKDLESLRKLGWEIGSHSATHENLNKYPMSNIQYQMSNDKSALKYSLEEEVINSKKTLEKELGISIPYFSYPRGKYTNNVLKMVKKAGYTLAVTMDDGIITGKTNPLLVPRVGVDRTHSFAEFTATYSPSVVAFRQMVKKSFVGRYL